MAPLDLLSIRLRLEAFLTRANEIFEPTSADGVSTNEVVTAITTMRAVIQQKKIDLQKYVEEALNELTRINEILDQFLSLAETHDEKGKQSSPGAYTFFYCSYLNRTFLSNQLDKMRVHDKLDMGAFLETRDEFARSFFDADPKGYMDHLMMDICADSSVKIVAGPAAIPGVANWALEYDEPANAHTQSALRSAKKRLGQIN